MVDGYSRIIRDLRLDTPNLTFDPPDHRERLKAAGYRSSSGGNKNENFRSEPSRGVSQIFLPQTLDRAAPVVRIGLVETKLRQHPSHLTARTAR